ncbi:glutathione peroxidase [Metschnikowia aff. pulcherrima]|uniref:Glutathione peroxidase n=1 Tax=Metschnikowia aff. pulcherrima TaxID=2163413 RepID=A0A4P6XGZ2_9ASCO|nr:glutathione peroxidase [Metschnikowia aff. pulcherrima]
MDKQHATSIRSTSSSFDSITPRDMANDLFYSLTARTLQGKSFSFELLRNKVVLIVNVASLCGFTPQYNELQAMYQKFHRQGFEILAFPCNQFGGQEPYDDAIIQKYVQSRFNVSFPIFPKVLVNGRKEDPVFRYLKLEAKGALGFRGVRWNFEKFVIDLDGNVVARFDTVTSPKDLEPIIAELLHEGSKTVSR